MEPNALEKLYTAEGSRELDRIAIAGGQSGIDLMRRAGGALFDVLLDGWPSLSRLTICCGRGNNAGDGYVVAGLALSRGISVQLLQIGDPAALGGDAAIARDEALAAGVSAVRTDDGDVEITGEVVVDALLGTGIQGAPRSPYARLIERMNASGRAIVAVDIPSGVAADTGAVAGAAIQAHTTVTFIGRKIGLYTGAGVALSGHRVFASLGVGSEVHAQVPGVNWLTFDALASSPGPPVRDADAYKQALGHVVVIGGDRSMGGAVSMAAEAVLRCGAGMVTVITRDEHRNAILARRPEVMVLDANDGELVGEVLARAKVLVLGPGLGRRDWGRALFDLALEQEKPTLIDADGLYWLAEADAKPPAGTIITPHVAEAATLLGASVAEVQSDRLSSALALSKRAGGVAVLKGAGTVVAEADTGIVGICAHGNPGMASAGMGDVLSGVVGGLLGQGSAPVTAAALGVCLHSLAADRAARTLGEASLLATDLMRPIIELLASAAGRTS
jgi:NAD(P)H-hydrate epimerase